MSGGLESGFESFCPRERSELLECSEDVEECYEDQSSAVPGLPADPAEDSSPEEALEYLSQR